jgi:hypothetical protein
LRWLPALLTVGASLVALAMGPSNALANRGAGAWDGWQRVGIGQVTPAALQLTRPVARIQAQLPNWAGEGGILSSRPSVGNDADGRLEVFVRGTDNAVYRIGQSAPSSGPWTGYQGLGGGLVSDIAVAQNADGRLEIFAVGLDNAVYNNWQPAPNSGPWNGWSPLGGQVASDPGVGRNSDGRLEVFIWAPTELSGTAGRPRQAAAGTRPSGMSQAGRRLSAASLPTPGCRRRSRCGRPRRPASRRTPR